MILDNSIQKITSSLIYRILNDPGILTDNPKWKCRLYTFFQILYSLAWIIFPLAFSVGIMMFFNITEDEEYKFVLILMVIFCITFTICNNQYNRLKDKKYLIKYGMTAYEYDYKQFEIKEEERLRQIEMARQEYLKTHKPPDNKHQCWIEEHPICFIFLLATAPFWLGLVFTFIIPIGLLLFLTGGSITGFREP